MPAAVACPPCSHSAAVSLRSMLIPCHAGGGDLSFTAADHLLSLSASGAACSAAVQEGRDSWPRVIDIHFEHNSTVATPAAAVDDSRAVTLQSTGMYYLWFVSCEDALSAATVHGQTVWKNPTGYLPGEAPARVIFELLGPLTGALGGRDKMLRLPLLYLSVKSLGSWGSWGSSQCHCAALL